MIKLPRKGIFQQHRKALSDAYTWILTHIGKTDRKYAKYYLAQAR